MKALPRAVHAVSVIIGRHHHLAPVFIDLKNTLVAAQGDVRNLEHSLPYLQGVQEGIRTLGGIGHGERDRLNHSLNDVIYQTQLAFGYIKPLGPK